MLPNDFIIIIPLVNPVFVVFAALTTLGHMGFAFYYINFIYSGFLMRDGTKKNNAYPVKFTSLFIQVIVMYSFFWSVL